MELKFHITLIVVSYFWTVVNIPIFKLFLMSLLFEFVSLREWCFIDLRNFKDISNRLSFGEFVMSISSYGLFFSLKCIDIPSQMPATTKAGPGQVRIQELCPGLLYVQEKAPSLGLQSSASKVIWELAGCLPTSDAGIRNGGFTSCDET